MRKAIATVMSKHTEKLFACETEKTRLKMFYFLWQSKHNTVNVRNPNVRISDNAEIRTISCSVWSCSDFERSGPKLYCSVFERSDFRHKFVEFLSEIGTKLFGFQTEIQQTSV